MAGRVSFNTGLLTLLAVSSLTAASGQLELRIRDVQTGYSVSASVRLDGPESTTLQTGIGGNITRSLTTGKYRVEVSAPSYNISRTHFTIIQNSNLRFTVMLEPTTEQADSQLENMKRSIAPGSTFLHGYLIDDDTGRPLEGVRVRFQRANAETHTDNAGRYYLLFQTPAPDSPDGSVTDTLSFEKAGFQMLQFDNFSLVNGEITEPPLEMKRGAGTKRFDSTHKLKGGPGDRSKNNKALRQP